MYGKYWMKSYINAVCSIEYSLISNFPNRV